MSVSRPRQFDLIVFDWDGTLFDSTATIVRSIQAACQDVGVTQPSQTDAAYVIGLSLDEAWRQLAPGLSAHRYAQLAQRYRHHYQGLRDALSLFPGVVDMLAQLKARHHWLGVATGKTRLGLDQALSHAELRGMFDATRTADETLSKPHPRMLQELMRLFAAEPERTLMVGDTTHDLQLAANAGAAAVAVSYGAHEPDIFSRFAPRFVAHSVVELRDWLLGHA